MALENLPIIGVIACGRQVEGEPAQAVKHRYLEATERHARAAPVIVPTNQPLENAKIIVARLDAILLTGSNSNIAPDRYGSPAAIRQPHDPARDDFAAELVRAAISAGKPVFGICRGLQEINVALGGSLRDLRDTDSGAAAVHHAPDGVSLAHMFGHSHEIEIVPGSQLGQLVGTDRLTVNSVHYQTIDRLGQGLTVEATAPDGIIEAVSSTSTTAPVFAVQWHPEWHTEERNHDRAFFAHLGEVARTHYPEPK